MWFDPAARRLVTRAYEVKGQWAGVYVGPPTPAQLAELAALGINPFGRDRWGEQRWIRGFKRSCFWLVNHYGGVAGLHDEPLVGAWSGTWVSPVRGQWETGQLVYRSGWATRRRAVRFRIHAGGSATSRIGKQDAPKGKRWIDDRGHATERVSYTESANEWVER